MRINYCYMYIYVLSNKSLVLLFCVVCVLISQFAFSSVFKIMYKWCKNGKDSKVRGTESLNQGMATFLIILILIIIQSV